MKRILILTMLLVMTASLSFAQEMDKEMMKKEKMKEKLVMMENQAWQAWKDRDSDFFKSYLADEAVNVGAWGVMNKAQMLADFGGAGCEVRSFSLDQFSLALLGDTAVLTYQAKQDATCDGTVLPSPVWSSSVLVKQGDKWLSVLYQETPAQN